MPDEIQSLRGSWDENTSREFIDYGRYLVPERERQMQIIASLLADLPVDSTIVDLCCGEGLMAEVILEIYPRYKVQALDGSDEMLARAQTRLARFGERFGAGKFDLALPGWRQFDSQVQAFISSLAIHHLPGFEKQVLFKDLFRMLAPSGMLVIADIVEIRDQTARRLAAEQWDESVRQRSLQLDGNLHAFEFFRREGWNTHRYLDPEDIDKPSPLFDQLKWFEEAGFTNVEVNWAYAGHAIFSGHKP